MIVGVVDIGTNSMRMLITTADEEIGRWVEVTGLGVGVDEAGRLDEAAVDRSIEVFGRFGQLMSDSGVAVRKAIATSASRDAENREEFFDRAEAMLGVRPTLIDGPTEARYAFEGATGGVSSPNIVVSDIGGGSTEFVDERREVSVDIGSVRLTDRFLRHRPVSEDAVAAATDHVAGLFASSVDMAGGDVVGVAGTWTSVAALASDAAVHHGDVVEGVILERGQLEELVARLRPLELDEIAAIPTLDPGRAPVILGGSIVALGVLSHLGVDSARVSERDTLDGVAAELLDLS